MPQKLLVSNTIVLARNPLVFHSSGTVVTGAGVNLIFGKYVKRIYVYFRNQVIAAALTFAKFNFVESGTGRDYGKWSRNDLSGLNFGLIEASHYVEEFRYFKSSASAAQHEYSWMINVDNNIDLLQMQFVKSGAQIFYEVFTQDL